MARAGANINVRFLDFTPIVLIIYCMQVKFDKKNTRIYHWTWISRFFIKFIITNINLKPFKMSLKLFKMSLK